MNPSIPDSPRLVCRVARGWLSVSGNAGGESRGAWAKHVAGCDACQQFFAASDALDQALLRGSKRRGVSAPPGLERKIALAVTQSLSKPQPRPSFLPMALAGVGGIAAVALLLFLQPPKLQPETDTSPSQTNLATLSPDWESLKPSANALLSGEPLQREVDSVVADARSAIRFLELNFLPPSYAILDESGRSL